VQDATLELQVQIAAGSGQLTLTASAFALLPYPAPPSSCACSVLLASCRRARTAAESKTWCGFMVAEAQMRIHTQEPGTSCPSPHDMVYTLVMVMVIVTCLQHCGELEF